MGVTGLWQLIGPVGKPVTLESLENKVLAVDVSIWLNQALKGFRGTHGESVPNAHLYTLCHRICKLLFYKIKPVFVFDGATPLLKKQTLVARERQRQSSSRNAQRASQRILTNFLTTQAVQSSSKKRASVKERTARPTSSKVDDIFRLPNEQAGEWTLEDDSEDDDVQPGGLSLESNLQDLNSVDVTSADFQSLPPDIRYEILSALKDSRRRNHARKELPQDSKDFSDFQLSRLLERGKLQQLMDEAVEELSKRQVGNVMQELYEEGDIDDALGDTHKIVSEDAALAILIKTQPKKQEPLASTSDKPSVIDDINEYIISSSEDEESAPKKTENVVATAAQSIPKCTVPEENAPNEIESVQEISVVSTMDCTSVPVNKEQIKVKEQVKIVDPIADWLDKVKENKINPNIGKDDEIDSPVHKAITTCKPSSEVIANKIVPNNTNISMSTNATDEPSKSIEIKNIVDMETTNKDHVLPVVPNCMAVSTTRTSENNEENLNTNSNQIESSSSMYLDKRESVEVLFTSKVNLTSESGDGVSVNKKPSSKTIEVTVDLNSDEEMEEDQLFPAELFHTKTTDTRPKPVYEPSLSKEVLHAPDQESALAALQEERVLLMQEKAKHQRQAQTVSQQILAESQELLQLFGVPFVVSPTEAEAQCAVLEALSLTQGTITDDSDIWLFGGNKVYRHFFQQDKYVHLYAKEDIKTHFGLEREHLICFAMVTGSDYTDGIEGAGAVAAMEIMGEFKGKGLDSLKSLKSWWVRFHQKQVPPGNKVRAKLSSLHLPESFPREEVYKAYLNPTVDNSDEKFTWRTPDLCALRELLNGKLGWKMEKVNNLLLPVMKKVNEKQSQTRLDSFFSITLKPEAVLPPSKRLQKALRKINPSAQLDESPEKSAKMAKTSKPESSRTSKTSKRGGAQASKISKQGGTKKKPQNPRKRTLNSSNSSEELNNPDDPPVSKKITRARCVLSESSSDSDEKCSVR